MLTLSLHLLALTIYLGCVAALWVLLIPSLRSAQPERAWLEFVVRALKIYNPLQTAALGLVVLSGAFGITELKAAYRGGFAQAIGGSLALKLGLSFFLIVLSTYQTVGIGHRLVKRYEAGETLSTTETEAVIGQLRVTSAVILLMAAPIVWLGLHLQS